MPETSQPKRAVITLAAFALLAAALLSGCASREEKIQKLQAQASQALYANDTDSAIEILSEGLKKFPDSNEVRIALSRAHQNAGNFEQAALLLEQAIEQDPESDQLWVNVGEIRVITGQSDAAIRAFQSYLTNHANDFLAWKAVALENEKLGRTTEAIKAASKWNELTPSSQPALKLGELYLASRNFPQARSWFSQAAAYRDQPAAKDALAELIRLETSLTQFQQASNWLSEYTKRYGTELNDPRVRESKTVLDDWQRARDEIARAAAELESQRRQLEAENARDEQVANNTPAIAPPTIEIEESEPETEAAVTEERPPLALFSEASPNEQSVEETAEKTDPIELSRYETAIAANESQDFDTAIPLFWELLGEDANANDPQLWYQLSKAYFGKANWFDAEATILQAKNLAPRSEVIANQYLRTILNTQSPPRALEEIKAIRLLFPRSPAIALTLAQALRNNDAHRSIVAGAYRDFLSLANSSTPGFQEANQYLQSGN